MMVLVSYDIATADKAGQRRLSKIAKACESYGIRVQYSVFECDLLPAQWVNLKAKLLKIYNPDVDSLRFYQLGANWDCRVEHYGAKPAVKIYKDLLLV